MTKVEEIERISEKMEKLRAGPAEDHFDADNLLLELIRVLSKGTAREEICKEIENKYEKIEKWYA